MEWPFEALNLLGGSGLNLGSNYWRNSNLNALIADEVSLGAVKTPPVEIEEIRVRLSVEDEIQIVPPFRAPDRASEGGPTLPSSGIGHGALSQSGTVWRVDMDCEGPALASTSDAGFEPSGPPSEVDATYLNVAAVSQSPKVHPTFGARLGLDP